MAKITKETSPFQVGVVVAVISHNNYHNTPRRIRRGVVSKVHLTGRFFLEGSPDTGYTPMTYCGQVQGISKEYGRLHVQLWTPEIEAEIENQKAQAAMEKMMREVSEKTRNLSPVTDANKIRLLHSILGYDEARCLDITVKDTYGN